MAAVRDLILQFVVVKTKGKLVSAFIVAAVRDLILRGVVETSKGKLVSARNGGYLYGQPTQRIRSRRIQGSGDPAMARWNALGERIPKPCSSSSDFECDTSGSTLARVILTIGLLLNIPLLIKIT